MNSSDKNSRRKFIKQNALLGAGLLSLGPAGRIFGQKGNVSIPAISGGDPIRTQPFPSWPIWKPKEDEQMVLEVLRSGVWSRACKVKEFEETWARTVGADHCIALVNGTNSLICSLIQLDIGAGDEVLVPPYTFIATIQAILQAGALPVFVDIDRETFQIDHSKIESRITPNTRAIMPVHICGLPADMPKIMAIAKKHNLKVVEDACQAWTAEINHQQMGTFGDAGCFSFQNSKNIPIGEGGAIVSNDEAFIDRCFSYQNYGNPYGSVVGEVSSGTLNPGTKLRWTEYQAAIGMAQLERFEAYNLTRIKNAEYLKGKIKDIPGIKPYVLNEGVTRAAFHLFPFRYLKDEFMGLSRAGFLKALRAEGIPCSSGYATLNNMPYLENTFKSKNYKRLHSKEALDYKRYAENNQCPENDQLCNEEAVWFYQNMLLGSTQDMDDIFSAVEKVQAHAEKIKKTESS
ncbi:MAG: DegT/DnrJ/EryC1/StrS family aminotransferase [Cyclobacteriaceae bacterium]